MNEFGVIGLGVMGRSISLNLLDNGFSLSVYNRQEEKDLVEAFVSMNSNSYSFSAFTDLREFVNSLSAPRKILIMIKAGPGIDGLIGELSEYLSSGDIIIDGGNSFYKDTARRDLELKAKGLNYIGSGVSGGEKGARFGPSIMPGGDKKAYELVSKYLTAIAAEDGHGGSCCSYIGPSGSGHFVKMIHNGIEYGEMQLIAELYDLLRRGFSNEEIAGIFESWSKDGMSSYLLDISIEILRYKEDDVYLIDKILDKAGNKGTGSWSTISALEYGLANTMMSSATFARYVSAFKNLRTELSRDTSLSKLEIKTVDLEALKRMYYFSSIINHHQGFEIMKEASKVHNWNLDLSDISRVWSNGCIIRSQFINKCHSYFKAGDNLLKNAEIFSILEEAIPACKSMLARYIEFEVPSPCFYSAFNYFISITQSDLPANMIQAQRDYFGAHTYQLKGDDSGRFYHTEWD